MNPCFKRLAAGASLAVAALAAAPVAQAAMISYNFEVSGFGLGSQAGNTLAGSFSYDDGQIPASGLFGESLYALSTFSFTFNSVNYSVNDLVAGSAAVVVGGQFTGLDAAVANVFQFLPDDGIFPASFAYELSDTDRGSADVTYTLNAVPEPDVAALLAIAMLGACAARRIRARQ